MNKNLFDLQLFADGESGETNAADGTPAEAGQNETLEKMGVPTDKLSRKNKHAAQNLPKGAISTLPPPGNLGRPAWEEIIADPEYSRCVETLIQSRIKKDDVSEENMNSLRPAPDAAGEERDSEIRVRVREHLDDLHRQGERLKCVFSSFDLKTELKNPVFAKLTAPGTGLDVESAYYALHFREIQAAAMQAIAQKAAEKLSNSVRSNGQRPQENGTAAQAPANLVFDYSKASPAQREALKKRIMDAAARGQKIFPASN